VRLPQHEAFVVEHRYLAARVEREEGSGFLLSGLRVDRHLLVAEPEEREEQPHLVAVSRDLEVVELDGFLRA